MNEDTELFQFWSNSYLNSQINFGKFNKIEFKNIIAYGSITGSPILTLIKKYNYTSQSNHECAHLTILGTIYNLNETNIIAESNNKLENLLAHINIKNCKDKIDELVKENDVIHILGYRKLAKILILKIKINDNTQDYYISASPFLKEIALEKLSDDIIFTLIAGPFKTTSTKKSARIYLTPCVTNE